MFNGCTIRCSNDFKFRIVVSAFYFYSNNFRTPRAITVLHVNSKLFGMNYRVTILINTKLLSFFIIKFKSVFASSINAKCAPIIAFTHTKTGGHGATCFNIISCCTRSYKEFKICCAFVCANVVIICIGSSHLTCNGDGICNTVTITISTKNCACSGISCIFCERK